MKTCLRLLSVLGLAISALLVLLWAAPAAGESNTMPPLPEGGRQSAEVVTPVVFLHDPNWPPYAQTEITVHPEPPIVGQPTEICAWVLNTTDVPQIVTLDFGVANFGIGLPFAPIGSRTIVVLPRSKAKACVVWIPRQEGRWCVNVVLHQPGAPDQESQRNIDVWEALVPGVAALTVFPVQNPFTMPVTIHLEPKLNPKMANWGVSLSQTDFQLGPGVKQMVTLVVTPPLGVQLGSRDYIVDVEATAMLGPGPKLIGGFRKMDWPPVPLHIPRDPPYAESEISVEPYPPEAGEPTEICVELRNLSDEPQTVDVDFQISDRLGIGLPFEPIGHRQVVIPPRGKIKVCTWWIPPKRGQFCIQILLTDPRGWYTPQKSQRNIDVDEILLPGVDAPLIVPVRNPNNFPTTIYLTTTRVSSFFDVFLDMTELPGMGPGEERPVMLHVIRKSNEAPEDGTLVADLEAYYLEGQEQVGIGGIRKVFRPPIPIHRPQDPPYSESEISVHPYPPRAGEPVVICTELRNPTNVTQTVSVEFGVANFGIGIPFMPIDDQTIVLPPHSRTRVCTTWVPPIGGHFCVQIMIRQPGFLPVFSQRNLDVAEYLRPNQPDFYQFPVGNPFTQAITVQLGLIEHLPGWDVRLSDTVIPNLKPNAIKLVTMVVTPTGNLVELEDGSPVVDVEAYVGERLLGGFRKLFRPPVPIHLFPDPPYAEREISIEPYPPRAGEPTQICVELRNPTNMTQTVMVEFAVANFGIGLPFTPIQTMPVVLPPHSLVKRCVTWVPPFGGHFCVQVSLFDPQQRYRVVKSQRNMDVGEVFIPGQPTKPFVFPVGNPLNVTTDIELAAFPRLKDWRVLVEPRVLPRMQPGETRPVTLTVFVPNQPMPPDDTPVVDVEAYAGGTSDHRTLIGGFRKLYRPPVPIHRPGDPVYAEREISIHPYPPRPREPTEICVDVRNPTNMTQTITVTFAVANFGIGLPFHDIARPIAVTLPPNGVKRVCVTWVPPFGGHFCARVTLLALGHEPVWSQRNMDVSEILVPGKPSPYAFPVGNPTTRTVTVTLGLVPHVEGWGIELSQDVLPNLQPGQTRVITLTVTPPVGAPMPLDGEPVVDVEGYIGGKLIGGFRKIYRPPVPVHIPRDPIYAESEIFVDPYPVLMNMPTLLGAVVYNPTNLPQTITVTFSVAHFGIGLPFTQTGLLTPTMVVNVPPNGSARVKTLWIAQFKGLFCVQIQLQSAGHKPIVSRRNIDVGEPLNPLRPHNRVIDVGNPLTQPVTITLALINHRGPDWQMQITPTVLANVLPGVVRPVTLTVKPPSWADLADGEPVADVEAYVNGELLGGIRKIAKPPIPLHKPQDRPYAETEISVTPYPLVASKPAMITTDIMNTSEETQTVRVLFGVANFGFGIPFTTTGILTTSVVVTLGPGISQTVMTIWNPPASGHWCIQIILQDPNNQYPEQRSQRNVEVVRRNWLPCQPFTRDFVVHNPLPMVITLTLAASTVNLPAGWTYSTSITETVLQPNQSITVTLTVTPPCSLELSLLSPAMMLDTGGASGPIEINIEGYANDKMLIDGAGIQLQLEPPMLDNKIYLPLVLRQ